MSTVCRISHRLYVRKRGLTLCIIILMRPSIIMMHVDHPEQIPDELTRHALRKTGFDCTDKRTCARGQDRDTACVCVLFMHHSISTTRLRRAG